MATPHYLRLEEIIEAFKELGGESDWKEIEKLITKNRGGSYEPYLDVRNYYNTMFQLIQMHCEGYEKFTGPVYFEKVRKGRFRLVDAKREERPATTHPTTQYSVPSDTPTPIAVDVAEPPPRVQTELYRVLRDTKLSREIKVKHGYKCQICDNPPLCLRDTTFYAEVHHIKPLGSPHEGPDVQENILCVCPNCHVLLDYGAIDLHFDELSANSAHSLGVEYIDYHNKQIFGKIKISGQQIHPADRE